MTYSTIVKEIISTSKLLKHLQHDAQQDPVRHPGRPKHAHQLTHGVGLGRLLLSTHLALQLLHLHENRVMVLRRAVHASQRGPRIVDLALAVHVPGRLLEGPDTDTQDEGPQPAQPNDDAPGGRAVHLVRVGAVVEARGEEDAQGDEELVRAHQGPSDPGGCRLGLEHGDHETEGADAESGDETAEHELDPGGGGGDLNDKAHGDDGAGEGDGGAAAEGVGEGGAQQGADEGADGEKADDEAGAEVGEGAVLAEAGLEVGHFEEARDLTRVVAKDETAHGDEDAHAEGAVGEPGQRGVVQVGEVFAAVGARGGVGVDMVKGDPAFEVGHLELPLGVYSSLSSRVS